jgi:hypothetical protein
MIMARKTRKDLETIRELAQSDYPPSQRTRKRAKLPTTVIATKLRRARKAQGLTWYALAKAAGIPNPNTVRESNKARATPGSPTSRPLPPLWV